jgi:adenylate cyclase
MTVNTSIKRKLATILAADVAGYTRLMDADEEATLRRLAAYRDILDGLVAEHDGRVFNAAGDSAVAEFGSPVEAVRCAAAIQTALGTANQDLDAERRMDFRIGLHLGDVMIDGDNLLGDGVNVAARLEALAAPGGLVISGTVHEQIDGKLELPFVFDGEQMVKNRARPVPIFRLVMEGDENTAESKAAPDGTAKTLASIAVLPFENLGGDREQDYFADGISEDLITELARFQELSVIARNSSFTYKGKAVKIQDVGRDLNVRYVLEGSVRKAGNRVRITAQLIDAETGHHLWAERFDRDVEDLFAVQDEVTQRIVATLAPTVEASERKRARGTDRTDNLDAYDLALKAREHWFRFDLEARRLYEQAAALDPEYARAYSGIAWTYLMARDQQWTDDPDGELTKANEFARKAVGVNPASHSAWLVQGWVQRARGELARADESMTKAVALNPNDSDGYVFQAHLRISLGEPEEAVRLAERAIDLSTNVPVWHHLTHGAALYAARRYEDAVSALSSADVTGYAKRLRAMASAQLGDQAAVKEDVAAFMAEYPDFTIASELAKMHYKRAEDCAHYEEGLRKAGFPE